MVVYFRGFFAGVGKRGSVAGWGASASALEDLRRRFRRLTGAKSVGISRAHIDGGNGGGETAQHGSYAGIAQR